MDAEDVSELQVDGDAGVEQPAAPSRSNDADHIAATVAIVQALERLIGFFDTWRDVSVTPEVAAELCGFELTLTRGVLRALAAAEFLVADRDGSFRRA
jgi:hypothetical protein